MEAAPIRESELAGQQAAVASDAPDAPEAPEALPRARMGIALLALAGIFISAYMLLFKLGLIGELACGDGACATVQLSPWADFLGLPVALWGVVGYAVILVTALAGIQPGRAASRRIGLALLVLAGGAFAFSIYLSVLEEFVIGAWCRWCIASAVVATLIFGLSLTELPRVRRRGRGVPA
jgi:uncharacterized membrane protein